jgi:hypothetical protein
MPRKSTRSVGGELARGRVLAEPRNRRVFLRLRMKCSQCWNTEEESPSTSCGVRDALERSLFSAPLRASCSESSHRQLPPCSVLASGAVGGGVRFASTQG